MFPFHFSFSTLSFSEEQKKTHLTRSTPLPLLHLSFYSLFYRVAARRNHSHSRPIHWDDPLDEGVAGDAEGAAQVRHEPDERGEQVSFFFLFFFFSLSLYSLPSTQKNAPPPLSLSPNKYNRTDVGAYHRDGNLPETSAKLSELSGQFSLMVREEAFFFPFRVEVERSNYVQPKKGKTQNSNSLDFFSFLQNPPITGPPADARDRHGASAGRIRA